MARAKRSHATTTEGRFLAARIQDAHRRGYTNAEIARAYGINERTVRKIRSGETSGRRTFGRLVEPTRDVAPGASPSIVRVDIRLSDGRVRSVNARIPTIRNARGQAVAATPADIFRMPKLQTLIQAEARRLETLYALREQDEDDETVYCARSYCGHEDVDHEPTARGAGHCELCRCPKFLDPSFGTSVLAFRPIVRRQAPLRIDVRGFA